ncbi:unnamed protein product, partial [Amoebophrya sp. A120]
RVPVVRARDGDRAPAGWRVRAWWLGLPRRPLCGCVLGRCPSLGVLVGLYFSSWCAGRVIYISGQAALLPCVCCVSVGAAPAPRARNRIDFAAPL